MSQQITQTVPITESTVFEGHHSDPGVTRTFPGKILSVVTKSATFVANPAADALATAIGPHAVAALALLRGLGMIGEGNLSSCSISPTNPRDLQVKYWCDAFTKVDIVVDVTFEIP